VAVQEEREAVMRIGLLTILFGLSLSSTVLAQDWAKALFSHTSHDFGVVARGAKVQHRFTLENIYEEDVHISSVQSSCNCTIPEYTKDTIKTYETADIIANVDTRTFLGRKEATIRVTLDKPFPAEVQLHVYCYIRSDVVVEPGEVQFGTVSQGTRARKKLTVSYAGRADWRIVDVQSSLPHLQAKVVEVSRAYGRVAYDLWIDLKEDAPPGYLKDTVVLVTNDRNPDAARVPVAVEGLVVGTISAQPSPLPLGILQAGQTVTRNLVVQGKKPFRILSVTSADSRFQFAVPPEARPVQLLPVTFSAGDAPGPVNGVIQIRTNLSGGESLEVKVDGLVLAKETPTTSKPQQRAAEAPRSSQIKTPNLPGLPQDDASATGSKGWKPGAK
jgi:hypothetical protein